MRMNSLPNIKTQTSYTPFIGGLDLMSPSLSISAGKCVSITNYECNSLGGYHRIDGYERFDGRVSPSEQSYYFCEYTKLSTIAVGDTIVGATSGATGKVLSVTDTEIIITRVTGVFVIESIKVSVTTVGTLTTIPTLNGCLTGVSHATARSLVADDYRADILAVPGSGVLRGVCMLKGIAYAFRNNAAGTNVEIYKSTSTGWQKITLFSSLPFKNCTIDVIDGVVINQNQGSVNAGSFVINQQYTIDTVGTTDFTVIGATANTVGITFTATGVGSGTGVALKVATATVKRQVIESSYIAADLDSSSVSNNTVATGSKTFTIEKNKAYITGDNIIVTSRVNALNYMVGTVTSYTDTTIVVNVSSIVGTGTFSDWLLHAERSNLQSDSGRFIITNIVGTFTNNAAHPIRVGAVNIAVVDSAVSNPVSAISILPGGNYQFVQYNFYANIDAAKIYGTDSLNRAFEFDGDVFIPIRTQIDVDAPTMITVVNDQLVLSYYGQLLFSAVGNPHDFRTTSLGFADLGLGDTVTGMSPQPGGVLAVFTRDSVFQVSLDTATSAYVSKLITPNMGAIHYGVLNLGGLYAFDDKGIVKIVPSSVFGGFEHDTISRPIQPLIDKLREKLVASVAYRSKNQCRFYASDGTGIIMTMANGVNGIEHHFSQIQYPIEISYAWSGEDASGRDIVLLGDNNGFVYVANKGTSFDGQEITAYIRTAFNSIKSPSAIKRFRKLEIEMNAVGYGSIRVYPDFAYSDPDVATHIMNTIEVQGTGGFWDDSLFDTFYYDSRTISQPEVRIFGSSTSISLVFLSQSKIDAGHKISGVIYHYTPRKLNR